MTPQRATLVLAGCLSLLSACASGPRPHAGLTRLWREFLELPDQRALALAGDPGTSRWVAGAAGGYASREEAEADALAECARRRAMRRFQDPCRLYGVGSEIVWKAW
jgi:hypothetical protein